MAEFPAMPLWTDAYLGDTRHLTTFEHGAYLLLLIVAWRSPEGTLPDDDRTLARYAGCTRAQWARIAPTIRAFFKVENGRLLQSRLNDERKAVRQKRESQAANGRASALKNKERHATNRPPSVNPHTHTLNTLDKSNGGAAADPLKELFDIGVSILVGAGKSESQARSLIGKWRKETKSDAKVLDGLLACQAGRVSEPVEWLTKRFGGSTYTSASGYEYRGDRASVKRQAEARADWGTYWKIEAEEKAEKQERARA